MSQAHFIGGSVASLEQRAAQRAQLRKLPETIDEGGRQLTLSYNTSRTCIYLRSEPGGVSHNYFAYAVVPVNGALERDELIASDQSLDRLIDLCNRWENEH